MNPHPRMVTALLQAGTPLCPTGYATDLSTPVSPLDTPQAEGQEREERDGAA